MSVYGDRGGIRMKVLHVGDLHLDTKEVRSTKKLVENNEVMLKGIYDTIVADEEIELLIFMGDIQHKIPTGKNTLMETTKWKSWFKKIGEVMKERYQSDRVKVIEPKKEGKDSLSKKIEKGEIYPVFTLRGNHDIDNEIPYTFYDNVVDDGLMCNPERLVIDGETQYNFYNYGEADKTIKKKKGVKQVIGLYHDVVVTEESPFWVGKDPAYPAETILEGIDLAIIGHIHSNSDPIYVETESGQSVAWTFGSMGRTSFSEGQIRDVGYCALVDTEDITQLGLVEVEVIKGVEYFNMKAELKKRENKREYKDFSLKIEDGHVRTHTDPRDDIREMEGLEDKVRDVCLDILHEVMEG